MNKNFLITLSLSLFLLAARTQAQDISISATINKGVIRLDEQFVLEINVSGNVSNLPNPELPPLPDFTAYSSGRSQNVSIVNGQVSSSISFNYALVPKSPGKFTIQPITLKYNGSTYQTQPISVEVTAQGASPGNQTVQNAPPAPEERGGQDRPASSDDLFVTAALDKSTVHVNEQVTYIFRFYRKVRLLSNPNYVAPDFSGFWTEDLPPQNYYKAINGVNYLVTEVKTILFPTKPGNFTINKASLQCSVEDFNADDFFGDQFFSQFFSGGKTKSLATEALSLKVFPLPDKGKPADFSGAVGSFGISAELDRKEAKTGEAVTLSVTVSGTGNIKTLSEPAIPGMNDFRKYDSVSSLNLKKDAGMLQGSKVFKTVIVPQTPGEKYIAPVSFSFFDPVGKSYRTVSTPQLSLKVKPGSTAAPLAPGTEPYQGVKVINRDVHYIKTRLDTTSPAPSLLYKNRLFIAANALPLALCAGLFLFVRWQDRLNLDVAYARSRRASSTARKYLVKAKSLKNTNSQHDFYTALSRALIEYIADKTNVSADGLTFAAVRELLLARKAADENINSIKDILDECDMVRFAPTNVNAGMMDAIYLRTEKLIKELERVYS